MDNFDKTIGQLSDGQFRQYATEYLKAKKSIKDEFCKFVDGKLNKGGVDRAEKEVEELFTATKDIGNRWDSYEITDWEDINYESEQIFKRAEMSISQGNPDIAVAIAMRWLECFEEYYDEEEESYYDYDDDIWIDLSVLCERVEEILEEAMKSEKVSKQVREDALRRIGVLADNVYHLLEYIDVDQLMLRLNVMGKGDNEALATLNELIEKDPSNSDFIIRKWELLTKMDRHSEAEALLVDNIKIREVANFYVKYLSDRDERVKLESVLEKLTADEKNYGVNQDWLALLAGCYRDNSNPKKAQAIYERLFVLTCGDLSHYHELKKLVDPDLWGEYLKGVMGKTPFGIYDGFDNKAKILIEEGLFEELVEWLKRDDDLYVYRQYLCKVPEKFQTQIYDMYYEGVMKKASSARTRKQYAEIARLIDSLLGTSKGEKYARLLVQQIRSKYSNRPAFQAEIYYVAKKVGK